MGFYISDTAGHSDGGDITQLMWSGRRTLSVKSRDSSSGMKRQEEKPAVYESTETPGKQTMLCVQ